MLSAAGNSAPFWKSLCELCSNYVGEPVQKSDFDSVGLPEYLKLRIEMQDERGKAIATSRDLAAVQLQAQEHHQHKLTKNSGASSSTAAPKVIEYPWQRNQMSNWDIVDLPRSVIEPVGGVRIERFPTLLPSQVKPGTAKPPEVKQQTGAKQPPGVKPSVPVGNQIATGVVDHPHLAEQYLRESVIRMFANSETREIKSKIQ
jgi:hypothetical protein